MSAHQQYPGENPPYRGQPRPIPPMTIGNRNPRNLPVNSQGKRGWSHGLCDCFGDCGTCCYTLWCPCVVYSKTKHRLEYLNSNGRPDPSGGGSGCNGDCCLHCCLTLFLGVSWVLQMSNRSAIRSRYHIDGEWCSDCLTAWCCMLCELVQESREIELEEKSLQRQG